MSLEKTIDDLKKVYIDKGKVEVLEELFNATEDTALKTLYLIMIRKISDGGSSGV